MVRLATATCCIVAYGWLSAAQAAELEIGQIAIVVEDAAIVPSDGSSEPVTAGALALVEALEGDRAWVRHVRSGWIAAGALLDPEMAVTVFSDRIRAAPDAAAWWLARGNAWAALRDCKAALKDYGRAIALDPQSAAAYAARGYLLGTMPARPSELGYRRALGDLCRAVELAPDNPLTYFRRGEIRRRAGQMTKAAADLDTAIESDPLFVLAYSRQADLLRGQGEFAQAIELYDAALVRDPRLVEAYLGRARCHASLGDPQQAIADVEAALSASPGSAAAHHELAKRLSTTADPNVKDLDRALAEAKAAVRASHWQKPTYIKTLAKVFAKTGNRSKAVELRIFSLRVGMAQEAQVRDGILEAQFHHDRDDNGSHAP